MQKGRNNYQRSREEQENKAAKEALSKILKKRIETTMIGALSTIEDNLSFLWDNDKNATEDHKISMLELYKKVRSEILDKGNYQARNIELDLSNYEIKLQKYHYDIPVNRYFN